MSRIFVTNLPSKISEEDIKKHFSQKGNITDVKLIYKNGEFRRYGYVGFEKEEEAQDACSYYNNSYIKQAKVTVKLWQDFKNADKPISWREKNELRKKAEKEMLNNNNDKIVKVEDETKSKKKKRKKPENSEDILKPYENDPDFKEFMKTSRKGLEEEIDIQEVKAEKDTNAVDDVESHDVEDTDVKIADKKEISDLDYLKSLMTSASKSEVVNSEEKKKKTPKGLKEQYQVVIRTKERCKIRQKGKVTFTKRSVKDFLKPLKWKSLRIPPKLKYVAYIGFKTERDMRRALQKHKSFLNGARVMVLKYERPAEEKIISSKKNASWSAAEEKLKKTDPVAETGRLYVRNLWYSVTEDDLRELFEQYGKISDVTLPICKITRRNKGFATIEFMFPEHSVHAMTELDGTNFKGRILHILPAHSDESENKDKENESFKDKKAREQKATAGSWHNWNTLFMGSGAVIDIMAQKYQRSKQEILNAEGKQSVAVNLALGETQIVDETRRFMENNGIALDAFTNPGVQRSNTVILVKNLPANTTAQELSKIFSRYGELGRLVLPPAGVTGIVEYLDPGEAKKGFRNLAYAKFHYLPLYLEWAPLRVFKSEFVPKAKVQTDTPIESETPEEDKSNDDLKETAKSKTGSEKTTKSLPDPYPDTSETGSEKTTKSLPDPEPNTTVYVKNLNFTTTEEVLKGYFKRAGLVHSVLIAKKRGLSQGYGFVQYVRQAHAQKALREINQTLLEEKYLLLKLSEKTLVTQQKSARMMHDIGKQTSTKIMVKNIPFEATRKEVRQLFATFGELKTVRLPNKPGTMDHRGFGFIDFVTREEAKKAFEALCQSTHLYGRRLALEWAKEDETVEQLREKTAQNFLTGGPQLKKKRIAESLNTRTSFDENE